MRLTHSTPLPGTDLGSTPPQPRRTAMTLIEMLVAMAATLMLMAAVAQAFSIFGKGISGSRAALDTAGRMRSVAWRLRQDLAGATAPTLPPLDPAEGLGYFEVIEGPRTDTTDGMGSALLPTDLVADIDDVLLFTTRSSGPPFRGRFENGTIESDTAEVIWFARATVPATNPPSYTLYRKQLLVLGYVGAGNFELKRENSVGAQPLTQFYDRYDVSVSYRASPTPVLVPNTLSDLTNRESRFLHNVAGDTTGAGFPYWFINQSVGPVMPHQIVPAEAGLVFDNTNRVGEDIVLTNVIAFDVRVFDPVAPLQASTSGSDVLAPGDLIAITTPQANGAYVDLGNAGGAPGQWFTGAAAQLPLLTRVYDTWSLGYEADGIDQDGLLGPDQGTDGLDSTEPPDGVIDDVGERETSAPYPYPLRGVEVRIRCYEPTSRQVRQVTVRHTFVPH